MSTETEPQATTNPAVFLRVTADMIRDSANAATRGPWVLYPTSTRDEGNDQAWTISRPYCEKGGVEGCEPDCCRRIVVTGSEECPDQACNIAAADAEQIATWGDPLVALAVADLLDNAALWHDRDVHGDCGCEECGEGKLCPPMVVARTYRGEVTP